VADTDPRGRPLGVVADLVKTGLIKGGLKEENISLVFDGREATQAALDMAEKGDIVVLQADDVQTVLQDVLDYKEDRLRNIKERIMVKAEKVPYGED
jgi:cyanophycin synthetase